MPCFLKMLNKQPAKYQRGNMTLNIQHDIINNEELLLRKDEIGVRDRIIAHNLKLVKKIANKFDSEDEDVFSEGMIGLIKAVDKYDPERGYKFSTFATPYIRGTILDYYNRINYVHPNTFSANTPVEEAEFGDLEVLDCIADEFDFEEELMQQDMMQFRQQFVNNILEKSCNERDRDVYRMHMEGKSKHDITHVHNISRERIRQIIMNTDNVISAYVDRFYDKSLNGI